MLSILIPTYNYNTFPLVKVLQEQAERENLVYEIILSDDASTGAQTIRQNEAVRDLEHCQYHYNTKNLGRGENRNALCLKAQYPWVLLLDCDTMPVASTFVKKYADYTRNSYSRSFFWAVSRMKKHHQKGMNCYCWVYGDETRSHSAEKTPKKALRIGNWFRIFLSKRHSFAASFSFGDL